MRTLIERSSGTVFRARDARGLVREMHRSAMMKEKDDDTYMLAAARRAEMQTGKPVRTSSANDFLADLIGAGLLQEEPRQ